MFKFSQKSCEKLQGVHKDLVAVVNKALEYSKIDFGICWGLRTPEEQLKCVANKSSQTLNSRHLYGLAVDIYAFVNGKIDWDYKHYIQIANAFDKASKELNIPIRWGGTFKDKYGKNTNDGGHFELDRSKYPDGKD